MRGVFRRGRHAALGAALVAAALAVPAAPAAAEEPAVPPGLDFEDCPALPEGADPELWFCNTAVVGGGRLKLGRIDQEINAPLKITYATGYDAETGEELPFLMAPMRGQVRIDGGLAGIPGTDRLKLLQVHAQPELTEPLKVTPPVASRTWFLIKMRIKLVNPILGKECHIGSAADPITLEMGIAPTSPPAPNEPISGSAPVTLPGDPPVWKIGLVDNAFAVPGAVDCGYKGFLDKGVNWRAGIPAAAGKNTAVFDLYLVSKPYSELPA